MNGILSVAWKWLWGRANINNAPRRFGTISILSLVDLEPYRFWASSICSRKLFVFIMYKDGIPLTQNRLCCRTFSIFKSYDFCWFRYSIDDWWRVCWVHKTDPNGINIYRTIWHHITRNKITNFNKILCKHRTTYLKLQEFS